MEAGTHGVFWRSVPGPQVEGHSAQGSVLSPVHTAFINSENHAYERQQRDLPESLKVPLGHAKQTRSSSTRQLPLKYSPSPQLAVHAAQAAVPLPTLNVSISQAEHTLSVVAVQLPVRYFPPGHV